MIREPIYNGLLQSDLDCAHFNLLNFSGGGGGGSSSPLISVNIKNAPYNAAGDGVTNDTLALQSAINDLSALGGGRIFFPPGTYLISGALQDTSGRNAQILLPILPVTSPPVTIELLGALAPTTQFYIGSPLFSATAYSTIKSTLTGATGSASFIAGKESGTDLWDNVQLVVRDLIFQAPPNPSFTAFNCLAIMGPIFERVVIHTGSLDINTITEPTHTNAIGIKLAPSSHSTGQRLSVVNVYGFYTGLLDGELAETHANFSSCKQAVLVPWNVHLSSYRHLGVFNCTAGIVAAGVGYTGRGGDDGTHYLRVSCFAGERSNSGSGYGQPWSDMTYYVDDAANLLTGDIKWLSVRAGIGNDHTFPKNGGTKLLTSEIGTAQTPSTTGWTAPSGTDLRSGYATSTATLTQVAQSLKSLITDLKTMGILTT
jgi:hypothetical protein